MPHDIFISPVMQPGQDSYWLQVVLHRGILAVTEQYCASQTVYSGVISLTHQIPLDSPRVDTPRQFFAALGFKTHLPGMKPADLAFLMHVTLFIVYYTTDS